MKNAGAKLLDALLVDDSIPRDRIGEAEIYARLAAKSGKNSDIIRLAGVLLAAAGYADSETDELRYMAESIAHLDGLARLGCEDSARLIGEVSVVVSPEALALADRVNRKIEEDER